MTVLGDLADPCHYDRHPSDMDETTSDDTLDCSSSNGGRWSDLMAQIDYLIEEA
ncbi:hypothetical protein [Amycolatopsis speibonae]|uniref:Uncharacterized protein n=1 Tax=Amycolatopsis speibonae TaxID=1450224 RepID=A0ABV7P4L5_9PSEU